ncbi:MAG: sialate O-acetylesterase [Firmicutes bacterium]|nr:sialate O-acetylesterase [Bacillota bacterium]
MRVSPLFSDGMVLQRDREVAVWGTAETNAELEIEFAGRTFSTASDHAGDWKVSLPALPAGGPYRMRISGYEELVVDDVYIGDVWLLGGQSNMELPVGRTLDLFAEEVATAENPLIRQFTVPQVYDFAGPKSELSGGSWQSVTPQSVLEFSAVGYFFAQELFEEYKVPQGLIQTAVGGSPVEAWLDEETLMGLGNYQAILARVRDENHVKSTMKAEMERMQQWYGELNEKDLGLKGWAEPDYDDADWETISVPGVWQGTALEGVTGSVWLRKEFDVPTGFLQDDMLLRLGAIIDADETYLNGVLVGKTEYKYPPRRYELPAGVLREGRNTLAVRVIVNRAGGGFVTGKEYSITAGEAKLYLDGEWKYRVGAVQSNLPHATFFQWSPTGLYNGMVAPLRNLAVKGVLWYQGESNVGRARQYPSQFEAMVQLWRKQFEQPDLPFFYVQLPNFAAELWEFSQEYSWSIFREVQKESLQIPNTGMAVTIDVGEGNDLHPQDKKTVGQRLALLAKRQVFGEDIVAQGPIYSGFERRGEELLVSFETFGSALVVGGEELEGFEICGSDGQYYPAEGKVVGNSVLLRSERVKEPCGLRYAWANDPKCNLYNQAGLPAAPFSTTYEEDL